MLDPADAGQPFRNGSVIFTQQALIGLLLASIQPNNGVHVSELPFAPLIQSTVRHGVVVPGIDEQHFVTQGLRFALIKEP